MLDRGDVLACGIAQHGAKVGGADLGNEGAEFAGGFAVLGKVENDARIGIGGEKVDGNFLAAVNAGARKRRARLHCRLVVVQDNPHSPKLPRSASPTPKLRLLIQSAGRATSPKIPANRRRSVGKIMVRQGDSKSRFLTLCNREPSSETRHKTLFQKRFLR